MRRALVLAALVVAPLAVAAPADASPPHGGCAVGWTLIPTFFPFLQAVDKANPDGWVCTKNNAKGAMFVDNTSAATDGFSG